MGTFYADDLALLAESEEELLEMIRKWKDGMEQRGLKVNMGKTKVMTCKVRQGQAENSGKFPCGICKKGVGKNSKYVAQNARSGFTKRAVVFGIVWKL